jgi:hypothetical protein
LRHPWQFPGFDACPDSVGRIRGLSYKPGMKTKPRLVGLLVSALAFAAFAQAPPPCPPKDPACLFRALHEHPVRKLGAWEARLAEPLLERVAPASPQMVEYLTWDNLANGYPQQPRTAQVSAGFLAEVKAAFADLPREVQLLFVDRLAGIALVDDLGGTGYTDTIVDASGHEVAGYIVLDAGVLQRLSANEWATWKESSPFIADPAWKLEARIEEDAQDNRRNAIQYILLHELGHVLSIGSNVHPPWTKQPKDGGPDDAYPFFHLSWRTESNAWVPQGGADFALRRDVVYYFGAKLPAARMAETYAQLQKTNFATLYAASRPGDDFAESFASYVHVVLMGKPWSITAWRNGEPVLVYRACWDEPRCAAKRAILDGIVRGR